MLRNLWIAALFLGAFSLSALAQGPGFNMDERLEQAKEELGLTDEQATKLKEAYEGMMEKMMDFRNNPGDGDFRSRFQGLRDEMNTKLAEFLDEEQMQKLEGMLGRGRGGRGEGRGNPEARDARMLQRAIEQMDLTETEAGIVTEAVEALMATKRDQNAAVTEKRRALGEALNDPASNDDALAQLMEEVKVADEAAKLAIAVGEDELRELLTVRQQGVLVSMGILSYGTKPVY